MYAINASLSPAWVWNFSYSVLSLPIERVESLFVLFLLGPPNGGSSPYSSILSLFLSCSGARSLQCSYDLDSFNRGSGLLI